MSKKWMPFETWLSYQSTLRRRDRLGEIVEHWDWRAKVFGNPHWIKVPKDQKWLEEAWVFARAEWAREYQGSTLSYVYILQGSGDDRVKIGFSEDPIERLPMLQTGNPNKLQIIAVFVGDRGTEARLHERFEAYRHEGEWFDAEPVLAWLNEALR